MDKGKKKIIHKRISLAATILKFALLLFIIAGIPLYVYFFQPDVLQQFSSLNQVSAMFREYKGYSALVCIAAQIVQVIICFIPGQWIQIASGYALGFWLGLLLSLAGAAIGSVITYYLAKILGQDAMHLIFGEEKINSFVQNLNSKKAIMLVFLFYLIPGFPKDLLAYAAGISDMKLKAFLTVSMIGRTPGMIGSLLIGKQIEIGAYTAAVIIAVVAVILFILGIIFRNKLTNLLDKVYDHLYH